MLQVYEPKRKKKRRNNLFWILKIIKNVLSFIFSPTDSKSQNVFYFFSWFWLFLHKNGTRSVLLHYIAPSGTKLNCSQSCHHSTAGLAGNFYHLLPLMANISRTTEAKKGELQKKISHHSFITSFPLVSPSST